MYRVNNLRKEQNKSTRKVQEVEKLDISIIITTILYYFLVEVYKAQQGKMWKRAVLMMGGDMMGYSFFSYAYVKISRATPSNSLIFKVQP